MKKYKLLKDLPDSKIGDEYIWNSSQEAYYKYGNVLGSYWGKDYVENNPEWFEEVIEKAWEILSYYNSDNPEKRMCLAPLYECEREGGDIFSIKRLSDGEVFTIGDEVYFKSNITNYWIIDNFYIRHDNVMLARSKDCQVVEEINMDLFKVKVKTKSTERTFTIKELERAYFLGGIHTQQKPFEDFFKKFDK